MQFSLRTLLLTVAVLALLMAIVAVVNTLTSVLLVWFVLLVFCHVAANAWGSKSTRRKIESEGEGPPKGSVLRGATSGLAGAPGNHIEAARASTHLAIEVSASHLSHRRALSWWLFLPIPAGAVLGGYGGVIYLFGSLENVGTWKALAVTGLSSAAMGGFLAFLVSSFLGVAFAAMFDAQKQTAKP